VAARIPRLARRRSASSSMPAARRNSSEAWPIRIRALPRWWPLPASAARS